MGYDFRGKVAVITGASSGIGRATALALAREGANVVIAARTADTLREVAQEIEELGCTALCVPTDVTVREQVNNLVRMATERWGRVDILVANAGVYIHRRVPDFQVEDFERSMAVNFYGVLYGVLAVLPGMLERRQGHIVIMNSIDGKKGIPTDAPYVTTKFALTGLADVMRQELRGTGVHIANIMPGRVATPMISNLRLPWIQLAGPLRSVRPEAVARAVVRAIYKRHTEVVVPKVGLALIYANTLSPRLADLAVRLLHLEGWETQP